MFRVGVGVGSGSVLGTESIVASGTGVGVGATVGVRVGVNFGVDVGVGVGDGSGVMIASGVARTGSVTRIGSGLGLGSGGGEGEGAIAGVGDERISMNGPDASVGSGSVSSNGSDAGVDPGSPTTETPGASGASVRTELLNASAIGAMSQSWTNAAMAATVSDFATQRSKNSTYDRWQRSAKSRFGKCDAIRVNNRRQVKHLANPQQTSATRSPSVL